MYSKHCGLGENLIHAGVDNGGNGINGSLTAIHKLGNVLVLFSQIILIY